MTTWEERMTPRPPRKPRLELVTTLFRVQAPSPPAAALRAVSRGGRARAPLRI
jgi:hypothetical protein